MGLSLSKPPPPQDFGLVDVKSIQSEEHMSTTLTIGAGCYWGTEKYIKKFEQKVPGSILRTSVGFMGPSGSKANPSYREVCTGKTGHVEVLEAHFADPQGMGRAVVYEKLLRYFFMFHDPTTMNRQGNDVGTQYASVIFVHDSMQQKIAENVKVSLQEHVAAGRIRKDAMTSVKTEIAAATKFYPAHHGHQDYLAKNPGGYCNHYMRFKKWPSSDA